MSNRDIAKNIIDSIPESQMVYVINILENWKMSLEEAADDAFCEKLYKDYVDDSDPQKNEGISIEEFAENLGITL